jgi:two-component system NtrC family sensor kinase
MNILVAEDNAVTRSLLQRVLERLGHHVLTVGDGQVAWERFQGSDYRVVVTDWMMPGMDGLALCRRIRATVDRQYVYVVVLTAKDQKEDLIEVFKAGADDYITKPFDPEELRASLTKCERIVSLEERYRTLEDTLIESRNKLRVVFDSLQEEIVAVDTAFNMVSANQAFLEGLKAGFGIIIGTPLFASTPPRPAWASANVQAMAREVFAARAPRRILEEIAERGRGKIYKQIDGLPVHDEAGNVFQVVLVSKDITEDRRKNEKIEKLNLELRSTSDQIRDKNLELEKALHQLRETQAQILQAEKMASIGQLAAGVAHEINNPTGFVSSNLKTLSKYQDAINRLVDRYLALKTELRDTEATIGLPQHIRDRLEKIDAFEKGMDLGFVRTDIQDLIRESHEGTQRIKKIVLDLKEFAHPGQEQMIPADINRGLESTLNIVRNEFKDKARVIKDFGEIPDIMCLPQQLNQVFANILINSFQAIEKTGEIRISTRLVDHQVEVRFQDTGMGIEAQNLTKVFDPFFTTKDVGQGTGLGMNIAYREKA